MRRKIRPEHKDTERGACARCDADLRSPAVMRDCPSFEALTIAVQKAIRAALEAAADKSPDAKELALNATELLDRWEEQNS